MSEKSPFLDECYGMPMQDFVELRNRECPALKDEGVYLDYAASPPASLSTISNFQLDLAKNLYSNPHSRSPASIRTSQRIDSVRSRVMQELFHLVPEQQKDWDLIFTSGATAGFKLIAETFPWSNTAFRYFKEAHSSLVGMRAVAAKEGASAHPMSLSDIQTWIHSNNDTTTLFAYAAQCNATGRKLPLSLCRDAKRRNKNTMVILDAAAFLSTSSMDLGQIPLDEAPDFVSFSFYKIYGFPTGLGAVLIKRSSGNNLVKGYFGGGSVDSMTVDDPTWFSPRDSALKTPNLHSRFEDGTLPFLDIIALDHAMDTHRRLFRTLQEVSTHSTGIAEWTLKQMLDLKHGCGQPVCRIYNRSSVYNNGATIGFSLLDVSGKAIGHVELDKLAAINGFHIRTGGLCATGTISACVGASDADIRANHARGRMCWDEEEFGGAAGKDLVPTGIARISFGAFSTPQDASSWIDFLRKFYVVPDLPLEINSSPTEDAFELDQVIVYPIKSCAGHILSKHQPWEVRPNGLKYDREWMLVNSMGKALSQKRYPKMALIRPHIDMQSRRLVIFLPDHHPFFIPLEEMNPVESCLDFLDASVCSSDVRMRPVPEAKDLNSALSAYLGVACQLARLPSDSASRHAHFDALSSRVPILLSNESPFLLVNEASVEIVNEWVNEDQVTGEEQVIASSTFRGNFAIRSRGPSHEATFAEDQWNLLRIGTQVFQVIAPCRRCQMICIDQVTGIKSKEPFNVLSCRRRNGLGKIIFGVHLMHRTDLSTVPYTVSASDEVQPI